MKDPLRPGTAYKALVIGLAAAFACIVGLALILTAVHH